MARLVPKKRESKPAFHNSPPARRPLSIAQDVAKQLPELAAVATCGVDDAPEIVFIGQPFACDAFAEEWDREDLGTPAAVIPIAYLIAGQVVAGGKAVRS
jgi:hypothetical protein